MITGSEEDYKAMPDWMKPGAAQIVTTHPVWVDLIPWYVVIFGLLIITYGS
jgi:hypothetical protein